MLICSDVFSQNLKDKSTPVLPLLQKCWFYQTLEAEIVQIASDNDKDAHRALFRIENEQSKQNEKNEEIYLSLSDGKIISISPRTLEKYWETELAGDISSALIIEGENIYAAVKTPNSLQSIIYCLDKTTGITRWQRQFTESDKVFLDIAEERLSLVLGDGSTYSIDTGNGKTIWKTNLGSVVSVAASLKKSKTIVLGTSDKEIIALNLKDGGLFERLNVAGQSAVITEDSTGKNLLIGDKKGSLRSYSKNGKTINWSFRQGAEISGITHTDSGLIVSSLDNFIYLISEKNGKLIWKKRLPGRIAAEPQVKDNFLVIASVDENEAFVIELSSGKILNKIVLEDGNFFTGESIRLKNLFIYTTRRGLLGFSLKDSGC